MKPAQNHIKLLPKPRLDRSPHKPKIPYVPLVDPLNTPNKRVFLNALKVALYSPALSFSRSKKG